MPEPFKNNLNRALVEGMAAALTSADPAYPVTRFLGVALDGLEALELRNRSRQITRALVETLPTDIDRALAVLVGVLDAGITGWAIMPLADAVPAVALTDPAAGLEPGLEALRRMTSRWSSEFAIRPFLRSHPDPCLARLTAWTDDPDPHVRRLVSEGTRPRLPWGERLPAFQQDPAPLVSLLERLKDDESLYVRRSVANNLNDIAKDHPDLVAEIARRWLDGASTARATLVRHACRTLVKQGHPATLGVLGVCPESAVTVVGPVLDRARLALGETLAFTATLTSREDEVRDFVVDYAVHYRRARGGTSAKVFKWKRLRLAAGETMVLAKRHAFVPVTVRRYYAGAHRIEVLVNGSTRGSAEFLLELPLPA